MTGSKLSLRPLTIRCARYLFWFVNRPKIYSIFMDKDDFRSRIRNSRELSLYSGVLLKLTFLTSSENPFTFALGLLLIIMLLA